MAPFSSVHLALARLARLAFPVFLDLVRRWPGWGAAGWAMKHAVRWLSHHTGVPALIVAAVLVAVGWRLLKRSARFVMEVAVVAALLLAASELGWIQW